MEQTREEMKRRIEAASSRKILRRQMELLAEYSRTSGTERIPEASEVMAVVHKRLVKAERITFVRITVALFAFFYCIKRFSVKVVKLIKG